MEGVIRIIIAYLCDAFIGLLTLIFVGVCSHFYFKYIDSEYSAKGKKCSESTTETEQSLSRGRLRTLSREPTENDDVFHETMLKVSETQKERLQSLEENIRIQNEQDSLTKDLENCLRRLSDAPTTRDVRISVETVLKSNQLQTDELHLTNEQIQQITESVLQDEHLNETILETVKAIVISVLQERREGAEVDLESIIAEHTIQLTEINDVLQRLERCQHSQQHQAEESSEHMVMVQTKQQRLQTRIKDIENQVAALQNQSRSDSQNTRTRLKVIAEAMRREQEEHTASEMNALRDMTRRHVETLKCFGEKMLILEEWLRKSNINSELASLQNTGTAHAQAIDDLDLRVSHLNERLATAIECGVRHNVIQKQVDGIGLSVKRIDESMSRLLSRNGNNV